MVRPRRRRRSPPGDPARRATAPPIAPPCAAGRQCRADVAECLDGRGRQARSGEVGVAEFDETLAAEARLVAAVDHSDGQVTQAAHGGDIGLDVAALQFVEQRPVVDRVAGEQHATPRLPEPDAAGGVAREVEHLERAIAEVDDVAVGEQRGRRRSGPLERGARHAARGHRIDEEVGHVVAGIEIRLTDRGSEQGGIEGDHAGRAQFVGLGRVDRPAVELVEPTDVIAVGVGRDRQQFVAHVVLDQVPQRTDPERRVDHEVELATAYVPHVASQERMDVGFGDQSRCRRRSDRRRTTGRQSADRARPDRTGERGRGGQTERRRPLAMVTRCRRR